MRDLAHAQIQMSKEKGAEIFAEFRKTMFPWIETAQKRDKDQHKQLLEQIVKNGPLAIRPLNIKPAKSRLVQRKEKRSMTKEQLKQQEDLYKKLGKSIPV